MRGVWKRMRGLSLLLGISVMARAAYIEDKCYCYPEFDDTIKQKLSQFRNLDELSPYTYYGAKYSGTGDIFAECVCRDVTRVATVLKVTESDYVTLAGNVANADQLNINVTRELKVASTQHLDTRPALNDRIVSTSVALDTDASSDTAAVFSVEFVLKGRDAALATEVESGLKVDALGGGSLAGVGTVDTSTMTFTVEKCAASPLPAPANGNATATTNLAGETVIYMCEDGYRLSTKADRHVTTCDHTSLTWTNPATGVTCPEDLRCKAQPPTKPVNTKTDWKGSQEDGTVITYTCDTSYRCDAMNETKSKCTNKAWTAIATNFKCVFVGCLQAPPQVVDHGEINWDNLLHEGSQASYSCKVGYVSTVNPEPRLICMNQTWGSLPAGFRCIHAFADEDDFEEIHYFFIVTVPSVAGLSLAILVCLCCTRVDSPIFRSCNRRDNNDSYSTLVP